jgi:hypothetical protein
MEKYDGSNSGGDIGKVCPMCNDKKELSAFYEKKTSKDRVSFYCIKCTRDYHKMWYLKNREKSIANIMKKYNQNKSYHLERRRKLYNLNKEKVAEVRRKRRVKIRSEIIPKKVLKTDLIKIIKGYKKGKVLFREIMMAIDYYISGITEKQIKNMVMDTLVKEMTDENTLKNS